MGDASTEVDLRSGEGVERAGDIPEKLGSVRGLAIGQVGLGPAPDPLGRIEFGGIGGEVDQVEPGMAPAQSGQEGTPVDRGVVQQDDDGAPQVTEEVAKAEDDLRGMEVHVELAAEVEPAVPTAGAQAEGGKDRDSVMALGVPQERRLAPWGPGAPHQRGQLEPGLIEEDEVGAQPPGVFFTRGHSFLFHRSILASSRSRARRSGFWALQPIWCRSRPT